MNIKQAIERVEILNERIDGMKDVIFLIKQRKDDNNDVHVDIWNPDGKSRNQVDIKRRAMITSPLMLKALEDSIVCHKSEVDKLKPIIDMANLALKGAEL